MGGEPSRHIVVICLDSVRKDFFDSVASRTQALVDVSFDQCRAASSWSAPSYASMISGQLPHQHGVHTYSRTFDSLPRENTLFDRLPSYRTVGISSNVYAGPEFGFDQYFDAFEVVATHKPFPSGADPQAFRDSRDTTGLRTHLEFGLHALRHTHPLKSIANGAAGLVRKASMAGYTPRIVDDGAKASLRALRRELTNSERPQFVFVSLMEGLIPHQPARYFDLTYYDGPRTWASDERELWVLSMDDEYDEQYWDRRNQLYREAIDYLDRIIEQASEMIEEVTDREATIIVTADHGENLGTETDEGLANHTSSLSEGLLHVPFYLINPPEGYASNEHRYFSHLELPTLIEGLANDRTPDVFDERIPAEVVGLSPGPDPAADEQYWNRMIRCGYHESTKLVWDSLGETDRYELDPTQFSWQRHRDTDITLPEWATSLFEIEISEYKRTARDSQESTDLSGSTESRLEELGYL